MHVVRHQIAEAVVGGFTHRTGRAAMSVGVSRRKIEIDILVAPVADAGILVAADIIGVPAGGDGACELVVIVERKGKVARRVALAAMSERLGKVGAAIPLWALARVGAEAFVCVEHNTPQRQQAALIEGP